ncbi:MAG: DNA-3-methyladenine glycosylase 2 family protein [Coriobacteriia bacterium]|nr:DNA-3-methyladenine glycosylase 2 family protein [Coriobacteriia bacterium]
MNTFPYGHTEIEHLKRRDKKLAVAIDRIGMIERSVTPDLFTALVNCVVAQQISAKAADTVFRRLHELVGEVTPESIAATNVTAIQQAGMTMKKAGYLKGIAEAAISERLDFGALHSPSDAEIIEGLSSLAGIGVWTAEMMLIFSLARPDVVSWGDLAIRRGMMKLYGLETLSKEQFLRYRKRYSPYGSTASLYLWALSAT